MNLQTLSKIKNNVVEELQNASQKKSSSFEFIRHSIPNKPIVQDNQQFQVIVIGGTVMRRALCLKSSGKISIQKQERGRPPKFKTKKDFLNYIIGLVYPGIEVVAINFAYPLEPEFVDGLLDGKLLSGSKENEFDGMVGSYVGKEISKMVEQKTGKNVRVSVANDTISLLMSGLTVASQPELIGGIVGTGVNFAFFEGNQAINLESANFDKFSASNEAQLIDKHSLNRGKALFEKEVSGAYLYQHYNIQVSRTVSSPLKDTFGLEKIARQSGEKSVLARKLFDRSASLVACQIAGILEYKKRDCIAVMEGSLFWEAENHKTLVETYVSMLTKYQIRFIRIDDDAVKGAAMLVA